MEAFVYCWTDHKTKKLYVGSHKGTPDDGYAHSSKLLAEEMKTRPNDFTRQIIAEGSFKDMRKLEEVILASVDAKYNPDFYNMHNSDGDFYLKGHTKSSRTKISIAHVGKKKPYLTERNLENNPMNDLNVRLKVGRNMQGSNNAMFGKTHSSTTIEKMSEIKRGANNPNFGKKFSEKHRKKIAAAKKLYWENRRNGVGKRD